MLRRTPRAAHHRPAQVEPLLGPGDADVREAALLLQLGRVAQRAQVREDPVLEPGDEHDRELQALGGVQRHQRHDAAGLHALLALDRLVGDLVGVGDERDLLEEVGQRAATVARRVGLLELARDGDELLEVLQPGLVLRVGRAGELGDVAGALQHRLQHRRRAGARLDQHPQVVDQLPERLHRRQRPRGEAVRVLAAAQRLGEREALPLRERLEAGLRPVADAALGHVEHAAQRDGVLGVGQQPQVGQRVAYLPALVEAHPADHLVGQPDPDEHLLEDPRLRVGPVEHRDVGRSQALLVGEPVDLGRDEGRLVVLVVGDVADDLLALARVGPQVLGLASLVARDDRVGRGQDRLGGAVVLLQQDRARVGVVLLEREDVADRRAAEGVDRLVGVTDDAQLTGRRSPSVPACRRAPSPGRTARGWCPGTRRPARAGTAAGSARPRRGRPAAR